uniref:Large ribosomal subunit protein eL36 n=1 Tax=Ascaris suum TaxID=6253 RepID=F1LEI8_ASCSU
MVAVEALAVGLNACYKVTKNERKQRQNRHKGRLSKRNKIVRELVREVTGMAPYERRMSASRDRIDTKDVSRRGTKLSESWYARSLVWLLMSEELWSCSESTQRTPLEKEQNC